MSQQPFSWRHRRFVGDDDKLLFKPVLHQRQVRCINLVFGQSHLTKARLFGLPQASQTASRRLGRVTRPVCLLTCGPATPGGKVLRHLGLGQAIAACMPKSCHVSVLARTARLGELVVQAVALVSEADAPDPKLRDHMIDMLSTHFLVGPCVVMELPSPL